MQEFMNGTMKRGAITCLVTCLLLAATTVTPAADGVSVSTEQVSSTQVVVEVRNDTDHDVSGVIDVRVVVSDTPILVPVAVQLGAGESTNVAVDLSRLRVPLGPLSSTTDGPTPF